MSDVYIPEQDITETLPDGRTVLVAAAGIPVSMEEAKAKGYIKEPQPQGPSETKEAAPAEAKSDAAPPAETLGAQPDGEPLPVGKRAKSAPAE